MKLKYISILVFISGLIMWSMIGIARVRALREPTAVELPPKANTVATNKSPVVPKQETTEVSGSTSAEVAPQKSLPATPGLPKTLIIPKIGLSVAIESIGLDSAGRMAVPTNWFDVGWYNLGYAVGGPGSAVIDGHLDTVTGAPASFYKINDLEAGDVVTVLNDTGKSYTFKVTGKQSYDFDKLPLQMIFATGGTPGLNLITCAGSWDRGSHNYLQRLVVYTKME